MSNVPVFRDSEFFRSLSWMSFFMGLLHDEISERMDKDRAELMAKIEEIKEGVEREFNLADAERALRVEDERRHEAEMNELLEKSRNPRPEGDTPLT